MTKMEFFYLVIGCLFSYPVYELLIKKYIFKNIFRKIWWTKSWSVVWHSQGEVFLVSFDKKKGQASFISSAECSYLGIFEEPFYLDDFKKITAGRVKEYECVELTGRTVDFDWAPCQQENKEEENDTE